MVDDKGREGQWWMTRGGAVVDDKGEGQWWMTRGGRGSGG